MKAVTLEKKADLWTGAVNVCCALLIVLAIVVSVLTTHHATEHFLDGDASAELVLASHLAQEKAILSQDWYYSTELRVVNTQLVHAPLFSLFEDWHMVRFAGALILQAMLAASFALVAHGAGLSLRACAIGISLLILPTSVAYGRIVLYHTYYAPHIILGFLIVGFYLHALKARRARRLAYAAAMLLLSFLSGLGGLRQIIITHAPLVLLAFFRAGVHGERTSLCAAAKAHLFGLLTALAALAAALAGFLVNDRLLGANYWFHSYSGTSFDLSNLEKLPELLFGFLHQFGFRRSVKVISIVGAASLLGLFSGGYVLVRGAQTVARVGDDAADGQWIAGAFFAASTAATVGVSLLTGSADEYTRHLIPCAAWAVPMLCVQWDRTFAPISRAKTSFACTLLAILFLLCNSLVNAGYFSGHTIGFRQVYEGLYENEKLTQQLAAPLEAIREAGYDLGYGTRWESCTMMEMTDGALTVVPVVFSEDHAQLDYEQWLSLRSYEQLRPGRAFIMLPGYLEKYYLALGLDDPGALIHRDENYVVYGLEDPSSLLSCLHR